jgi:UDP-N-acetylglucosamine diphosphorylase / glucose-1-phosphate thymidylyltransferase / UDP-N-acetylgalactosamine diphosphorylase / glucosamine-1-phosphate N-acetyltransferase / galactosamine-1-phosphate N-acetyltransferase
MKAVILAAGKATRMGKLCETVHKCMLPVGGKSLLEWNMERVFDVVDEYFIIIGYRKEDIKNYFGNEFRGKKINYIIQTDQKGTGHALLQVGRIDEKFIVLMGDDWYPKIELPKSLAIFGQRVEASEKFGVLEIEDGKLMGITEKPTGRKNELVNIGFYVLDGRVFDELHDLQKSPRGELELTDAVLSLALKADLEVVEIEGWEGIAYPWELLKVNKIALYETVDGVNGIIEEGVVIKGDVALGKDSVILSGTYIEGPVFIGKNCKIGPNAYLRAGAFIGDNCHIGSSEIKNSIIMDNTNVPHLSYVGDSVIGRKCNLGAGTMIANLRFDGGNVKSMAKERIDTGLRKFGVVMCDNVKTGVNVSIMPGVVVSNGKQIMAGEVVSRDL